VNFEAKGVGGVLGMTEAHYTGLGMCWEALLVGNLEEGGNARIMAT